MFENDDSVVRRNRAQNGVALIMVVVVLTALMIVGTPFVISMRLHERGSFRTLGDRKAELARISARNHTVAHLFASHPSRETGSLEVEWRAVDAQSRDLGTVTYMKRAVDDRDEITVPIPAGILLDTGTAERETDRSGVTSASSPAYQTRNSRGRVIDVRVEDEQAKINLNTAPPMLLANLLGSGHLREALPADPGDATLPLDDTSSFPADEDDETIDGVVVLFDPATFAMEAVSYRGKTKDSLTGCSRGDYFSGIWTFGAGTPVVDIRALKIAMYRSYGLSDGRLRTYRTPSAIREIADISMAQVFLDQLSRMGMTLKDLRRYGLTKKEMEGLRLGYLHDQLEARDAARRKDEDSFEATGGNMFGAIPPGQSFDRVAQNYFKRAIRAYEELAFEPGLETFDAVRYESIAPFITTFSGQPSAWSEEQLQPAALTAGTASGQPVLIVKHQDFFGVGTLVRIRSVTDPNKVEYNYVSVQRQSQSTGRIVGARVALASPLRFDYDDHEALVSAALRHPINLNTAPFEVLVACLAGVRLRGAAEVERVTRTEARALASFFIENRPFIDFDHYREMISYASRKEIVDDDDVLALLLNAVNPNHPMLGVSTTAFCFNSDNTYTIESTGVVHADSGFEVARRRAREVVEAYPPPGPDSETLTIEISTQEEWVPRYFYRPIQDLYQTGRPGIDLHDQVTSTTFVPGREVNLMQTGPEVLTRGWEARYPHRMEGMLHAIPQSAAPSLVQHNGQPEVTFGEIDHFPDTLEGQALRGGEAFTKSTIAESTQASQDATDALLERDIITQPGMVELWVRPDWGSRGSDHTIFDSLYDPAQPYQNRILLYYEASTSDLVFQISDDTSLPPQQTSDPVSGRAVQVRHSVTPQSFADDTWYHISATWGSTKPGDQVLMIDRHPVGENQLVTRLAGALSARSYRLRVEDAAVAARFPRSGVLMVGQEAVEYESREGATFVVREADAFRRIADGRGTRGTPRLDHIAGTPVRLFGYSIDVLASDSLVETVRSEDFEVDPAATPEELAALQAQANIKLIPSGGARLDQVIEPSQRIVDYQTNEVVPSVFPMIRAFDPLTQSSAVSPSATTIDVLGTTVVSPIELGFPRSGYLQVMTFGNPTSGGAISRTGIEYIKYSNIVPGQNLGANQRIYSFTGLGRAMLGTERAAPGILSLVFGVSVLTDSNRLDEQYPLSGVVQLVNNGYINTTPTPGSVLPPEAEWIYYRQIAERKYFIADPSRQFAFRGFAGSYDYQGSGTNNISFRGSLSGDTSTILRHTVSKEIFPVIRIDRPYVGRDDYVFVAESEGPAVTRLRETVGNPVHIVRYTDSGTYVSFRNLFQNTYLVRGNPKIKLFPSGDLPSISSGTMTFGNTAGAGPGGAGECTVDEIRFSRARRPGVEFVVIPTDSRGRITLDPAPPPVPTADPRSVPQVDRKLIRRYVTAADDPESGGFAKVRVYPRGRLRLSENGGVAFRYREARDPDSFGLGKDEGICAADDEMLHYRFAPTPAGEEAIVALAENITADLVTQYTAPDADGQYPPFNPTRDLRAEVWPRIEIRQVLGSLPSTDTFLEVFSGSNREIIFYERAQSNALINVLRGQLGTPISGHIVFTGLNGDQTRNVFMRVVPHREVEILRREMLATRAPKVTDFANGDLLPQPQIGVTRLVGQVRNEVIQVEGIEDLPGAHGYVITDQGRGTLEYEILGYLRVERNAEGSFLVRAQDDRTRAGLFRGRFGTHTDQALTAGTTLVEFPVRYHDRYQPGSESGDLQYYQRSFRVPGAFWDSIQWDEAEVRNRSLNTQVRVVARFDGAPGWDGEITNQPGGLYLFTDGRARNRIELEAETVELRVYYHYPQGSYGRNATEVGGGWSDSWKHAPVLESLRVHYKKPWSVVHREDLPN